MNNDKIPPKDYVKAWQKRYDSERKPFADLFGRQALQLGVIDAVGQDTRTVVGLARYLRMQIEIPGEMERIKALGAAETDWYRPLPPPPASEKLTLILEEEPDQALVACLARDGFIRVTTDPEARPIVAMGRGSYKGYWALLEGADRVERGGPPGGILRGIPFTLNGSGEGVPPDPESAPPAQSVATLRPSRNASPELSPPGSARVEEGRQMIGARPYRAAEIERPHDDLALHQLPPAEMDARTASVVHQEGPLDSDWIATRLGYLYGQKRVCAGTRTKIGESLVRQTQGDAPLLIQTEGRFYHAAGAPIRARDRGGCAANLRAVANLPRIEIKAAVLEVLEGHLVVPRGDVVAAAARLFGYDTRDVSTYRRLTQRIEAEIAAMIAAGTIVARDDGLASPAFVPPQGEDAPPRPGCDGSAERAPPEDQTHALGDGSDDASTVH